MDDRWESEINEYGAINITGFRIVDNNRPYAKEFFSKWRRLDPATSAGAGKESISVCSSVFMYTNYIIHNTYTRSSGGMRIVVL